MGGGGVVVFLIRLVRGTLSLGLDLVFCLFLSLIFTLGVPLGLDPLWVGLFGLWSLGGEGESPACSLGVDLGGILLKCVFLIARTY